MQPYSLSTEEIALRLFSAAILGSLVGLERQRKVGIAGLRTHMLVCVGAALIMIVSAFGFDDILGHPNVVLDPSRIAAQVVSGIGFLGAGTIMFFRQQVVRGLTTAAGLWSVAAVGLAVGAGMYIGAFIATFIIFVILAILKPLELKIFKDKKLKTLILTINVKLVTLIDIEAAIKDNAIELGEIILHATIDESVFRVKLTFENRPIKTNLLALVDQLNAKAGVSELVLTL